MGAPGTRAHIPHKRRGRQVRLQERIPDDGLTEPLRLDRLAREPVLAHQLDDLLDRLGPAHPLHGPDPAQDRIGVGLVADPLPALSDPVQDRLVLLGHALRVGEPKQVALRPAVPAAVLDRLVPEALRVYGSVRRERTAGVQRMSRVNGARYEASNNLDTRDRQISNQSADRAWIWEYDAEAEAAAALAAR
jgi:hypothetical protein